MYLARLPAGRIRIQAVKQSSSHNPKMRKADLAVCCAQPAGICQAPAARPVHWLKSPRQVSISRIYFLICLQQGKINKVRKRKERNHVTKEGGP
jgi:hypothetical protein